MSTDEACWKCGRADCKGACAAAPACASCGKPATCIGEYESCTGVDSYACDDCCGHGNEDGHCKPLGGG